MPASTRSWRATTPISGKEHAAAARTLTPTAEAKAEAWELAMVRDDVPNETQRSIVLAFQAYGQDEVLAPYVEKYLAAADTMWEEKGTQRASTALEYIFPKQLASQELLDRVDAWLESSRPTRLPSATSARVATTWPARCGRRRGTPQTS